VLARLADPAGGAEHTLCQRIDYAANATLA
jgi:hypothetical protein